jgi:hypothetical protein
MTQLAEEMRARLNEIASAEQALVRALSEALSRVDQKLLREVRVITSEHETRRMAILLELQNLASRIGKFPPAYEAASSVEFSEPTSQTLTAANGRSPTFGRRIITSNIEDDLEDLFRERAASH